MKKSEITQGDFFEVPSYETRDALIGPSGESNLIIIGCGKRKRRSICKAADLYISDRFKTSRAIAENLSAPYLILSALHGLISPEAEVEPYDFEIEQLDEEARVAWATATLDKLEVIREGAAITILAEGDYAGLILRHNEKRKSPLRIIAPFSETLSEHFQDWLIQASHMSIRLRDLRKLYSIIDDARSSGEVFLLNALGNTKLPKRAVYIFLDPSEKNFMGSQGRIVRIGTHAISAESRSTLRNRLRNHLGKSDGAGNHRGSIFRLHVGRAMLEAGGSSLELLSWGNDQSAMASVKELEIDHEKIVSEYLGRLEVFIIPIDDEPSKNSLRAHVETQLIALCTEGLQTIDKPSEHWLGSHSPMEVIAASGLWNLRDVGKPYRPNELGSVSHIESFERNR